MNKETETIIKNIKSIKSESELSLKALKLWLRELVSAAHRDGFSTYEDFAELLKSADINTPEEMLIAARMLRYEDLGELHGDFTMQPIDKPHYVVSNFCNSLSEETYEHFFGDKEYKIIKRNSFGELFDDVYNETANYCIVPIENNTYGTLGNFYIQIFDYGLKIVKVCDILHPDGDDETRFALLSSAPISLASLEDGEDHFELVIHSSDGSIIPRILEVAMLCKMIPERIDSVPLSRLKKDHPFKIVFKMLPDVNLPDFLIYLILDGISYTPVGIFNICE
ncbi:MAG: hypothetical protein IKK94_07965 [Clostridia bacterium]|nr:hypothetical protein [Clostridia bacterium]